jgi:hypothetical protein
MSTWNLERYSYGAEPRRSRIDMRRALGLAAALLAVLACSFGFGRLIKANNDASKTDSSPSLSVAPVSAAITAGLTRVTPLGSSLAVGTRARARQKTRSISNSPTVALSQSPRAVAPSAPSPALKSPATPISTGHPETGPSHTGGSSSPRRGSSQGAGTFDNSG